MHEGKSGGERAEIGTGMREKDRDDRNFKNCGRHLFVTFSGLTDFAAFGHRIRDAVKTA